MLSNGKCITSHEVILKQNVSRESLRLLTRLPACKLVSPSEFSGKIAIRLK
jgi:hypothetical protein